MLVEMSTPAQTVQMAQMVQKEQKVHLVKQLDLVQAAMLLKEQGLALRAVLVQLTLVQAPTLAVKYQHSELRASVKEMSFSISLA